MSLKQNLFVLFTRVCRMPTSRSEYWPQFQKSYGCLCLDDVGWSDLGSPRRVVEVARATGEKNEWLTLWRRDAMRETAQRNTNFLEQRARNAS